MRVVDGFRWRVGRCEQADGDDPDICSSEVAAKRDDVTCGRLVLGAQILIPVRQVFAVVGELCESFEALVHLRCGLLAFGEFIAEKRDPDLCAIKLSPKPEALGLSGIANAAGR